MSDKPTLTVVEEDAAHADEIHQAEANHAHGQITELENRLSQSIVLEAEMAQHLEDHRARTAALAEDLRKVHEEAAVAAVAEAELRREGIVAETEAMRTAAAEEAEREATRITQQAFTKARSILAAAEEEAAAIFDARQSELATSEAEAERRLEALEAEEVELMGRVEVAKKIYQELQETLQAVAQASFNELATAKTALSQMQPGNAATPRRRSDER